MSNRGYSLLEVLLVVTLAVVAAGSAIPLVYGSVDRARAAGAASYVAGRLTTARLEAVRRSAFVAVRFVQRGEGFTMQSYEDGNGDGVLTADINSGTDRPISPEDRVEHHFSGVAFGILPGVGPVEPGQPFNPADPIQIGSSTLVSFSPAGSSTSGTVFVRGLRGTQYAVRILGATGRMRILRFNFGSGAWQSR